jgi:predicted dehydrogenase
MNVLIIGLGSIARRHIDAIRTIDPSGVIYALRSDPASNAYDGVTNVFSLDEISWRPDFVVISNPTEFHGSTIRDVSSLGAALFIEKPVLGSLAMADALEELIVEKGLLTYVACNLRFHPAIAFVRSFLQKNETVINEINVYCGSYLPDWRPGKDFRTVYSAHAAMGGGVHLDLIHELDYVQWLFGSPDSMRSLRRSVSSLQIDAVDYAHYQLLYKTYMASVTLNYYRRDPRRQIEIVTATGTITADLLKNSVETQPANEILFARPFDMSETYLEQMRYFIEHVKENRQPMNGFSEAVSTLKLAVYE